jgi:hypothetical protein
VTQLLILLVIALPPLVIGILIWSWVRQADAGRRSRGFEVKTNTGDEPVIKERREPDHG